MCLCSRVSRMRDRPTGSHGDITDDIQEFRVDIRIGKCQRTGRTRSHTEVPDRDGTAIEIDDRGVGVTPVDDCRIDISGSRTVTIKPVGFGTPV